MGEHKGGFASTVRVNNWQFAHPLPEKIAFEHAGPLMCAGKTVFTPLLGYGVRPTDRVAIVGVGGLGHLAVQYLAKWGCDVTAISSTHDKDAQSYDFGGRHFIGHAIARTSCRCPKIWYRHVNGTDEGWVR